MNLKERIEELGYHVSGHDLELHVYKHGTYIMAFERFERQDPWRRMSRYTNNNSINITNVENVLTCSNY